MMIASFYIEVIDFLFRHNSNKHLNQKIIWEKRMSWPAHGLDVTQHSDRQAMRQRLDRRGGPSARLKRTMSRDMRRKGRLNMHRSRYPAKTARPRCKSRSWPASGGHERLQSWKFRRLQQLFTLFFTQLPSILSWTNQRLRKESSNYLPMSTMCRGQHSL